MKFFSKFYYLKDLLSQGKYLLFSQIFDKVFYFAFFIILARISTQSEYGQISSINAFTNILTSFTSFGLGHYIQRASAQNDNVATLVETAVAFKLVGLIILLVMTVLYFSNSILSITVLILLTLTNYLIIMTQIFTSALYGINKYKSVFSKLFNSKIILFFLLVFVITLKIGYEYLILSMFLSVLFFFISLFLTAEKAFNLERKNYFKLKKIPKIFKRISPFGLGLMFVWIYDRIEYLILEHYWTLVDVALYAVAYSIYKSTTIFSSIILVPYYSKISKLNFKETKNNFYQLIYIGVILLFMAFSLMGVISFIGRDVLIISFGDRYSGANEILQLLIFAIPLIFLNNFTGTILNGIGKEKFAMFGALFGLLFTLIFGIYVVISYGGKGAAIVTICTEFIVFAVQLFFIFKYLIKGI